MIFGDIVARESESFVELQKSQFSSEWRSRIF